MLGSLSDGGHPIKCVPVDTNKKFPCSQCDFVAENMHQLGGHMWTHHKHFSQPRMYASGSVCPICRKDFGNRIRLIKHFKRQYQPKNKQSCFQQVVQTCQPLSLLEVEELDKHDNIVKQALRAQGLSETYCVHRPLRCVDERDDTERSLTEH